MNWTQAKAEDIHTQRNIRHVETLNGEIVAVEMCIPDFGLLKFQKTDWGMKVLKEKHPTKWILEADFSYEESDDGIVSAKSCLDIRKEYLREVDADIMKAKLEDKGFKVKITKVE